MNEVIVGSTSVFAPLAAGLLADAAKNSAVPFYIGAALIVMAMIYQVSATWRWRQALTAAGGNDENQRQYGAGR